MEFSIWELRPGERVTLDSGTVAEVVAPTHDGVWIGVKYIDSPESPEIVGSEGLYSEEEIVSRTA